MKRRAACLAAAAMAVLFAAASVSAKEGARAQLRSPLPLAAKAGTTVRITWRVDVPDGGERRPFNAIGMFVRLLSRTGAAPSTGFATATSHADGRYSATLAVPEGGIGGVRAGLRGSTDLLFPLDRDPFVSPAGVRCDVETVQATLAAFVRAFNTGDLRRLDRLFSHDRFVWFSSGRAGVRLLPEASRRESLVAYFQARHRLGDRIALRTFRFNGYDRGRVLAHFELAGTRGADDVDDGREFSFGGKGALDCRKRGSISVLSLG